MMETVKKRIEATAVCPEGNRRLAKLQRGRIDERSESAVLVGHRGHIGQLRAGRDRAIVAGAGRGRLLGEWCGPCKMLGPLLEQLAEEYGGEFVLAKIDTDGESELAQQFGVRSIPAVFGFRDGQAVDGFIGVQSETAIRAWLDRLMPTPIERLIAEARRLEASDSHAAEAKYNEVLALDPSSTRRRSGWAGRPGSGPARRGPGADRRHGASGFPRTRGRAAQGRARPAAPGQGAGGVEAARAALAEHPDDLSLKFQLAEALAASGQYADALAICLELVERDRKGVGEPPARPWSRSSSSCRPIPSSSPNFSGSSRWR